MDKYKVGSIVLDTCIITGAGSDTSFGSQYPCIGPTGGKNTVLLYNHSEDKADILEKQMAAWKALSYPGVLTPLAHGWGNGCFFVVVEQDLSKMLPLSDKRFGIKFGIAGDDAPSSMSVFSGMALLSKSAKLLGYIASHGIVHGRVSPDNLLCAEGCIYLNDFPLFRDRHILAYCSIEQMCGKPQTCKTDVYSWAVSVMELYLGKCPWPNGVVAGFNCAEYLERVDRTKGIPKGMRPLLERCLNMEPECRPDWPEIVDEFSSWLDEWYIPSENAVKIASDPNASVIESAGNTTKGDFSETKYLPPEEKAAPRRVTTPDGKYHIGRQIELDPPFEIFEAEEIKSGKAFTLLRLDPNNRNCMAAKEAMFKRYINSIIADFDERMEPFCGCKNIVTWSDPNLCWNRADIPYLIADAPYGQSLAAWAKKNVPVGKYLAFYLIDRLLTALRYAHARGWEYMGDGDFMGGGTGPALVHMSVSPENIRIVERGEGLPLLLLDGFDTALPAKEKTEAQYCVVPAFSSRWQVINASCPDPAWDVWAAAACLYYLLTGKYPRDLSGNTLDALLNNKPVPIRERKPDIAPELAVVIDRALDDSRGLYYAEVNALWDDLLAAMKDDDYEEALKGCWILTSVNIPRNTTNIKNGAFAGCGNLTSVTIPEGVTTIGEKAFYECGRLVSVTIPDSVTTIGDMAFAGCGSLTIVNIPHHVTTIRNGAFAFCNNLTDVTIPDSVTTIGNEAFIGCGSLTNVTIPDSVTTIGEKTFYECGRLASVTIPKGITSIGNMAFAGCSSLTSLTIPDSVTAIGDEAFIGCSSLKSVTIPEGVTSIGDKAFGCCESLASVTIPEGVTSIGDKAFACCGSLASVTIPDSVTSIGEGIFHDCESLTSVTIPDSVTRIGDNAFAWCKSLAKVTIPGRVTFIGKSAFAVCGKLTLTVSRDSYAMKYAFDNNIPCAYPDSDN